MVQEQTLPEKAQEEETLCYDELSERAQKKIDRYRDNLMQHFTFYAKRHGQGYLIHAVEDRQLDLLEAQGGMGPGWLRVIFVCDEEKVDPEEVERDQSRYLPDA